MTRVGSIRASFARACKHVAATRQTDDNCTSQFAQVRKHILASANQPSFASVIVT